MRVKPFIRLLLTGRGPTTVREFLGRAQVQEVIDDFNANSLSDTEGVILIWAANHDIYVDTGGVSLAEALGALSIAENILNREGVSRP